MKKTKSKSEESRSMADDRSDITSNSNYKRTKLSKKEQLMMRKLLCAELFMKIPQGNALDKNLMHILSMVP